MSGPALKRIVLILAVVACAAITWATAEPWLESPFRFSGWLRPFWPALAVTVLAAVAGVAFTLLHSRWDRLAAVLASWASFIVFWSPDIWYVSALPLFGLLWYESSRRMQDDARDRLKVRINATLGRGVKLILLGAFLMVSVGFYLLPANRSADIGTLSRGIQGSIDDAYDSELVRGQLEELPSSLQAQFKQDIAESVDTFIHEWLGDWGGFVPPFLAFALFLTLWSVSFIFRELAIWLGTFLLAVLRRTKFISIEEKDVKAEVISL
jgi:hypothetical protein